MFGTSLLQTLIGPLACEDIAFTEGGWGVPEQPGAHPGIGEGRTIAEGRLEAGPLELHHNRARCVRGKCDFVEIFAGWCEADRYLDSGSRDMRLKLVVEGDLPGAGDS